MPPRSIPDVGGSPSTAGHLAHGIGPLGELTVAILGAPMMIRTNDARAAAYLRALWSRCLATTPSGPPVRHVNLPGTAAIPSPEILLRLTSEVTLAGIEHAAGTALMFHAAGVALPDGRVIALVGESGAGKTTATRALCRNDGPTRYGYVTDETVAVDPDLRVRPFAKPLALCESDASAKIQRGPDELELAEPPGSLTLAAVVLLRRDSTHGGGAQETALSKLDLIEALVPHTSALIRLPDPVRRLAALADRCPGYVVTYREAEDLAALLAGRDVAVPDVAHPGDLGDRSHVETGDGSMTAWVGEDDVLTNPEGGFLLVGGRPVRLSSVGVTLWHGMRLGLAGDRLAEYVVARHGRHPDALALLEASRAALSSLHPMPPP